MRWVHLHRHGSKVAGGADGVWAVEPYENADGNQHLLCGKEEVEVDRTDLKVVNEKLVAMDGCFSTAGSLQG